MLTGCVYSNVRAPLSYRSPTPSDVGGNLGNEAEGSACNTAILWLVAWGDGGYDAAMKDAREASHAALIADVKATKYTNALTGIGAFALALALGGCMPPYVANPGVSKDGTLYHGSTGPLSYESPTLRDGGASLREVSGEACQYSIVLPIPTGGVTVPDQGTATGVVQLGVGWGDGGCARAMANAERDAHGDPLVDIRADRHFTTVLWIYRRDCVEIHASAARR